MDSHSLLLLLMMMMTVMFLYKNEWNKFRFRSNISHLWHRKCYNKFVQYSLCCRQNIVHIFVHYD
jgi:hypothetical protein